MIDDTICQMCLQFSIQTSVLMNMLCWDASLSCEEGRMESSRGHTCAQCPLTVPSRTPVKSLTSKHSQRNTCPVIVDRTARIPSPETWSNNLVALPVKRHTQIEDLKILLQIRPGIGIRNVQLRLKTSQNPQKPSHVFSQLAEGICTLNGSNHMKNFWDRCSGLQQVFIPVPQK